jgi:hypothetical protein
MTALGRLIQRAYADHLLASGCRYLPIYRGTAIVGHSWVTPDDIAADLAPRTGLRLTGDNSVALLDTDPDWLCQGALTAAARRVMGRAQ